MDLIQFQEVSISFGSAPLLDRASLAISQNDQLCVLGRNGTGKSTLFKLLSREIEPDSGEIRFNRDVTISLLPQDLPERLDVSVYDFVASAFESEKSLLSDYHRLVSEEHPRQEQLERLTRIQQEIEHKDLWHLEQRINRVIERVELDADDRVSSLSGGKRRLLALAKAIVVNPDILLLDEPTNHLDIGRIQWLEKELPQWVKTWVFVTHDRSFANSMSNRIIELDRGVIRTYPGNLDAYYKQKEHEEASEANEIARMDKKLAQEETWIRQGIKARRTRNEGRVRALKALRKQVQSRRSKQGSSQIELAEASRSGKLVFSLENVSKSFEDICLFRDLNLKLMKGDRLGVLGSNGTGKSTLLKLMLGELKPDSGTVKMGTNLEIAYFDQSKEGIDLNKTVFENIADGNDYVQIGSKPVHVMGYLQNYLFAPNRSRSPASSLSGGELSRLMLARLMTKPFNLLVMDEPTNDLDLETLEILESQLAQYQGTLIIISHDRQFIDNTVTSVIHLDGMGNVSENVGGYSDWLARQQKIQETTYVKKKTQEKNPATSQKPKQQSIKLSYKDQREFDALPDIIDRLESELDDLQQQTSTETFYQQSHEVIDEHFKLIAKLENEIGEKYERWEELGS